MTYTPHCVIGLTGNLGAGKSTVAHIAEGLGARIIDSDRTVHNLLACDTDLALEIENEFGSSVMRNGWPDRSSLAQVVYNDAAALRQLEDLIFPRVARQTNKQLYTKKANALYDVTNNRTKSERSPPLRATPLV